MEVVFPPPSVTPMFKSIALSLVLMVLLSGITWTCAPTSALAEDAVSRGYRVLTEQPTLSSDFNQKVFDQTWQSWPQPLRDEAEKSTLEQRRRMAFERYGLTPRPNDNSGKPLQYVVDEEGKWTMNCFSCHGGEVYGIPTPGAPNNRFALQTMTEELRATKFRIGEPLSRMDLGSLVIPLGTTHGTTNAVVFGMGLMSHRDRDLNLINSAPRHSIITTWTHRHGGTFTSVPISTLTDSPRRDIAD